MSLLHPFGTGSPIPKPTRPPRPIKDPASFDPRHVQAVWGDWPCCILTTANHSLDIHHILGRGGKHDRKEHSSILNSIPLRRDIHDGPHRDDPDLRRLFLRMAVKFVDFAIAAGRYEMTENDRAFMRIASDYLKENNR